MTKISGRQLAAIQYVLAILRAQGDKGVRFDCDVEDLSSAEGEELNVVARRGGATFEAHILGKDIQSKFGRADVSMRMKTTSGGFKKLSRWVCYIDDEVFIAHKALQQ